MAYTRAEQETVIGFSKDEDLASVYTSDTTMIRKLRVLVEKKGTEWTVVKDTGDSMTITGPKDPVSLRTKHREVSEEQRKAAAERFRKMREEKK